MHKEVSAFHMYSAWCRCSFSGAPDGQTITEELGSTANEKLFYVDGLQLVKDSLQFVIEGTLMNGESFSYVLNLDVEQVF